MTTAIPAARRNRGTLFVEDAVLIEKHSYPGQQFVMRFAAPRCASAARAGSFVHIQCEKSIPLRRPLSIMRADADAGWLEILFKVVGTGLHALSAAETGDTLSIIGPIGKGFEPHPNRPQTVLIGGGVGIPPMIFLTAQLLADERDWQPLVLMGSEIPFPFEMAASAIASKWLPDDHTGTMLLLEEWGVCARLASLAGIEGCYPGYVSALAQTFLESLSADNLLQTEIFSCGPAPMLRAVAALAKKYDLPCQVSLEEFMACGIGGCAGCAVEVQTDDGPSMQRVCVDGPVFEAKSIFT